MSENSFLSPFFVLSALPKGQGRGQGDGRKLKKQSVCLPNRKEIPTFVHGKTFIVIEYMLDVKKTLNDAHDRMEMAADYLEEELARIRAGRANAAILDAVRVNSYGSKVPLNQVATIMIPDPRTIAIKPWDKKAIRDIEKAIMDSDVGITPENNGEVVRLNLPQPTEERRRDLVKQCNKIGEKAKVEIRNVRSDVKDKLKKAIKDGLSEDNEKDAELDLQKLHDKFIKKVEALLDAKQKEIMTV